MPGISRLGDLDTGHGAWPPRASITASTSVYVNGKPVTRVGDKYAVHCDDDGHCHDGTIAAGSSGVYADGKPIARIGDPVSCGGSVAQGSGDILSG